MQAFKIKMEILDTNIANVTIFPQIDMIILSPLCSSHSIIAPHVKFSVTAAIELDFKEWKQQLG